MQRVPPANRDHHLASHLTDEQYFTFAGPAPFRPATGDDQLVGFGRGRQVFAEVAYNF